MIDVEKTVRVLERNEFVIAAYLHGSILTPHFRKDSDVDCAILLKPDTKAMNGLDQLYLAEELSTAVGFPVDLGVLSHDNLVYFVHAVAKGREIFCRDRVFTDNAVCLAFSLYAKLREDRKEIEEAYAIR